MSNLSAGQSVPSGNLAADRIRRLAFDVPGTAVLALIHISIGLAFLYAATIVYGIVAGYALPTAAVFHIIPFPLLLVRGENLVPRAMLLLVLAGSGFGWLKYWGLIRSAPIRKNEIAALRLLQRWGLFIAIAAAILALSDAWSELALGLGFKYFEYASIGGLVPYSDAGYHFLSSVAQVVTGTWSSFGSRRPLAAGFRELTMGLAGLSYAGTLLLQALLVSAAFFAAARSIALWRGLWCSLAFSALAYALVRPFITDTLTEPLGLFWGFLSVMFFVESMRANSQTTQADSLVFAFLALVTLTLGEMIRMGSLFTIPAFVLWISLAFSSSVRGGVKLFVIGSGLVLLVFSVQMVLSALYGNPSSLVGGNFAYTLCGLTVGGNWTSCPQIYAEELRHLTTEREQAAFLYAKAITVAAHDPRPMLWQTLKNLYNLTRNLPGFMMLGYLRERDFPWWPFVFLVPGFCWALWYHGTRRELLFWALMLASIEASAAIIFADDGWRVFYTTWPYVALCISLGFASPGALVITTQSVKPSSPRTGTVLVVILLGLIVVAPAAMRASYGRSFTASAVTPAQPASQDVVLAGRTITGFVVVPDDTAFSAANPAMRISEFRRATESVGIERDFGKFLDVAVKHVPFAFVTAARIDKPGDQHFYIAPAQILSEPRNGTLRLSLGQEIRLEDIHDVSSYQRLQ